LASHEKRDIRILKTLLVTPKFSPQRCGVGAYVEELARYLLSCGQEVCVLTQPIARRSPAAASCPLREVPLRGWRDLRAVLRTIVQEAPDAVQFEYSSYGWSRWGFAFWLNALFFLLRARGIPVRLALHEFPLDMRQHPKQTPIALLQRVHYWLLCAAAQEVCTNTAERVATLQRWLPWRKQSVRYRPNSNCNPVFPIPAEWRTALRSDRDVPPGGIVVATYGLFGSGKNMEVAIAAVAQLREELPVHLWLLGDSTNADGTYLEQLRRLAEPLGARVWWSRNLSPEDVSRHLQCVDIFLLPQPDGHLTRSGAFMAAAAHGLPVIAVRNDENQKGIQHAQHFWRIASSATDEIVAALRHLAAHPAVCQQLRSSVQALYRERFDWAVVHGQRREAVVASPLLRTESRAVKASGTLR